MLTDTATTIKGTSCCDTPIVTLVSVLFQWRDPSKTPPNIGANNSGGIVSLQSDHKASIGRHPSSITSAEPNNTTIESFQEYFQPPPSKLLAQQKSRDEDDDDNNETSFSVTSGTSIGGYTWSESMNTAAAIDDLTLSDSDDDDDDFNNRIMSSSNPHRGNNQNHAHQQQHISSKADSSHSSSLMCSSTTGDEQQQKVDLNKQVEEKTMILTGNGTEVILSPEDSFNNNNSNNSNNNLSRMESFNRLPSNYDVAAVYSDVQQSRPTERGRSQSILSSMTTTNSNSNSNNNSSSSSNSITTAISPRRKKRVMLAESGELEILQCSAFDIPSSETVCSMRIQFRVKGMRVEGAKFLEIFESLTGREVATTMVGNLEPYKGEGDETDGHLYTIIVPEKKVKKYKLSKTKVDLRMVDIRGRVMWQTNFVYRVQKTDRKRSKSNISQPSPLKDAFQVAMNRTRGLTKIFKTPNSPPNVE